LKRGLKYIIIYLTICIVLGYSASAIDFLLIELYSVDVKEEIEDLLDIKENVLVDGGMLALFLKDQMNEYSFEATPYNHLNMESSVSYLKNSRFLVSKDNSRYSEKYNIVIADNNTIPAKLNSINRMNNLMVYNKIFFNAVAVLVGLFLVLKYNRIIVKINKGVALNDKN